MSKKVLTSVLLLVPIVLLAFHYGPGQKSLARDRVSAKLEEAGLAENKGDWKRAVEAYGEALAALPAEDTRERYELLLAKANARIYTGELPEAMLDMENLLADIQKNKANPSLVREVRASLASAQYYVSWLMRLEGAGPEEWTLPIEEARQNFRLLAEEMQGVSQVQGEDYQKNLEAVIRLARMDLSELQALPLPKKCQGTKNCSQKCRSQRESKCKNEGKEKPKDARGAGSGKRAEGGS
jgi:hypothetical protein